MMKDTNNEWNGFFKTTCCAGCTTCEMACSYHHTKTFQPSVSSIKIKSVPEEFGFDISFFNKAEAGHLACDGCLGLKEPLCVTYCPVVARDELRNIVQQFQRTRRRLK